VIEFIELHRTLTGDKKSDNEKYKWRKGSLDDAHLNVAPYATQVRLVLWHDGNVDMVEKFINFCKIAGIGESSLIKRFKEPNKINTCRMGFFHPRRIEALHREFTKLPWAAAFQLEALIRNGLLHTQYIEELLPKVVGLCRKHTRNGAVFVGELLKAYNQELQLKNTPSNQIHPMNTFEEVLKKFEFAESDPGAGTFRCAHVTFTPTRMILEGPYATQSNRIIREYHAFSEHFIRVDFRDEDRLQYRWDKTVDGQTFLKERVGGILKGGFNLGGRTFEFLAYSTSALREHAVWFISPFMFTLPSGATVWVDGEYIRNNIGDFRGTPLLKCPSKYAARLAQAFTATDPSVTVHRNNWEEVPDLGQEPYLFTDGVGTISKDLGDRIWQAMRDNGKGWGKIVPSAVRSSYGVCRVKTHRAVVPDSFPRIQRSCCCRSRNGCDQQETEAWRASHTHEAAPVDAEVREHQGRRSSN